jgi:ribulose-phosphate 3-epimerase
VDGGVKPENAAEAARAGADVLVAGSAVFESPDYAAVIARIRDSARSASGR